MLRSNIESKANLQALKKEVLKLIEEFDFIEKDIDSNLSAALTGKEITSISTVLLLLALPMLKRPTTLISMQALYDDLNEWLPLAKQIIPKPDESSFYLAQAVLGKQPELFEIAKGFDESLFGYVYQFFCFPIRKFSQGSLESANKAFKLRETITFTQLYTPAWIIDFLLQNTIIPQWNYGQSDKYKWLASIDKSSKTYSAKEIRIIDPCCGSGHFLLRAFDLFYEMYLHEGYEKDEIGKLILENNIFGADIDPIALFVAALSLYVKFVPSSPLTIMKINLICAQEVAGDEAMLGSLHKDWQSGHILSNKYNVVVTNPPYIGRKLLDRRLKQKLKEEYPGAHQDLCAAFVSRGLDMLSAGGRLGYIAQASLSVLPTYKKLRQNIVEENNLLTVVDAGTHVFPLEAGEKINSAMYMIEKNRDNNETVFFDIAEASNKEDYLAQLVQNVSKDVYKHSQNNFSKYPNYAFNYKYSAQLVEMLNNLPSISTSVDVRQGLATTDNKRFVKYWWEVDKESIGKRWFPYVKGAGSERWYAPVETVVDWENDGAAIKEAVVKAYPYLKGKVAWVVKNEQYYFKEGLTFSFVNKKNLSVRKLPAGCVFDVGGSGLFTATDALDFYMAYLNSSVVGAMAQLINPTLNFQVGDIKQIPVLPFDERTKEELSGLAKKCYELKRELSRFSLTDMSLSLPDEIQNVLNGSDFNQIWNNLNSAQIVFSAELENLENKIDDLILAAANSNELKMLSNKHRLERGAGAIFPASQKDFAKLIVFHYLKEKLTIDLPRSIESALKMPTDRYVQDELPKDQNKWFHKVPMLKV